MASDQAPQDPSSKKPKQTQGTEDIVRQHLEDPNHIITEEDIKSVEVGKFETNQEYEGELLKGNSDVSQQDKKGDDQSPATPWDAIK